MKLSQNLMNILFEIWIGYKIVADRTMFLKLPLFIQHFPKSKLITKYLTLCDSQTILHNRFPLISTNKLKIPFIFVYFQLN